MTKNGMPAQTLTVITDGKAVAAVYGRAPWRILPAPIQSRLAKRPPAVLAEVFTDLPTSIATPSQAA